jgi:hypothetical protein
MTEAESVTFESMLLGTSVNKRKRAEGNDDIELDTNLALFPKLLAKHSANIELMDIQQLQVSGTPVASINEEIASLKKIVDAKIEEVSNLSLVLETLLAEKNYKDAAICQDNIKAAQDEIDRITALHEGKQSSLKSEVETTLLKTMFAEDATSSTDAAIISKVVFAKRIHSYIECEKVNLLKAVLFFKIIATKVATQFGAETILLTPKICLKSRVIDTDVMLKILVEKLLYIKDDKLLVRDLSVLEADECLYFPAILQVENCDCLKRYGNRVGTEVCYNICSSQGGGHSFSFSLVMMNSQVEGATYLKTSTQHWQVTKARVTQGSNQPYTNDDLSSYLLREWSSILNRGSSNSLFKYLQEDMMVIEYSDDYSINIIRGPFEIASLRELEGGFIYSVLHLHGLLSALLLKEGYDVECSGGRQASNNGGAWLKFDLWNPASEENRSEEKILNYLRPLYR